MISCRGNACTPYVKLHKRVGLIQNDGSALGRNLGRTAGFCRMTQIFLTPHTELARAEATL